jgi:hypothetical protein
MRGCGLLCEMEASELAVATSVLGVNPIAQVLLAVGTSPIS